MKCRSCAWLGGKAARLSVEVLTIPSGYTILSSRSRLKRCVRLGVQAGSGSGDGQGVFRQREQMALALNVDQPVVWPSILLSETVQKKTAQI